MKISAMRRTLAWLWVLCLGLTMLTLCLPPLEFSALTYRSVAHSGAWLLAFTGAGYFAKRTANPVALLLWRWLPRMQWGGVALVLLGLWWYGALYLYYFFLSTGNPNDTQFGEARVLLRRGDAYVVGRNVVGHASTYGTLALVRPISPFFNWVRPVTSDELDFSWQVVDPQGRRLLGSSYDRHLGQSEPANRLFRNFGNLSAAVDSMNAAFDREPLPPVTQTGRGTLGYVINGKNRHTDGPKTVGLVVKRSGFLDLESFIDGREDNVSLSIILSHFQGVGTYQMTHVDGPASVDNRLYVVQNSQKHNQNYKSERSRPATVVITHFDATRHIIAGTFMGVLHNATKSDSVTITQGQFDVHYE